MAVQQNSGLSQSLPAGQVNAATSLPNKANTAVAASEEDIPKEMGLEEEGFFDVIKPFKEAAKAQLDKVLPSGSLASVLKGAADVAIPDSPLAFAGGIMDKLGEAAKGLGMVGKAERVGQEASELNQVKNVKFPSMTTETAPGKVFRTPDSATREAYNSLSPEMQSMKRSEALSQLGVNGPPKPATSPGYAPPLPGQGRILPETEGPTLNYKTMNQGKAAPVKSASSMPPEEETAEEFEL